MEIADQIPSGWLVDPTGERMVLFIKDPMSERQYPKFYIDKWSADNGIRTRFKKRKIAVKEEAVRIWISLIENGWNKVEPLVGEVA